MYNQHWSGRDLTNSHNKTIYRSVSNQQVNSNHHEKCHGVIESITVSNCHNTNAFKKGQSGPITVKVPVVLAEPQIEINLESVVKLKERALEIKRIQKSVEITQCKLLPPFYRGKTPVFKLFIAGFVRKNIEYATAECENWQSISGNIRHTTVKVPFKCSTELKLAPGVTPSLDFQETNPAAELEFLDPHTKLERDDKVSGNINAQFLNEKPFCELTNSTVIELDIESDGCHMKKNAFKDKTFQTVQEKMLVLITLKVLQNQQVIIPKGKSYNYEDEGIKDFHHKEKGTKKIEESYNYEHTGEYKDTNNHLYTDEGLEDEDKGEKGCLNIDDNLKYTQIMEMITKMTNKH